MHRYRQLLFLSYHCWKTNFPPHKKKPKTKILLNLFLFINIFLRSNMAAHKFRAHECSLTFPHQIVTVTTFGWMSLGSYVPSFSERKSNSNNPFKAKFAWNNIFGLLWILFRYNHNHALYPGVSVRKTPRIKRNRAKMFIENMVDLKWISTHTYCGERSCLSLVSGNRAICNFCSTYLPHSYRNVVESNKWQRQRLTTCY